MQVELELTAKQLETLGDEWEVVRVGFAKKGEMCMTVKGDEVWEAVCDHDDYRLVVRRKWQWPEWIKDGVWIAMDKDGKWYLYAEEPRRDESMWLGPDASRLEHLCDFTPPPVVDWRHSRMQKVDGKLS